MRINLSIIIIICLLIVNGCTLKNSQPLVGKKLYIMNQGNKGGIGELELDFEDDKQVKLKLTCMYYPNNIKSPTEQDLPYLKQILSAVNGSYQYTFKDDVLTIPNTSFINLKLTHNGEFYTDSNGQLYHDKSILDLSSGDKIERIKQIDFTLVRDGHLPKEIVLNSLK